MNILPWQKVRPDPLREIVLGNLSRLRALFQARGKRFDYDASLPTPSLENALWHVLDSTTADMGLALAPSMSCEARISEITRNLPPLARPGTRQASQWPSLLQTAR